MLCYLRPCLRGIWWWLGCGKQWVHLYKTEWNFLSHLMFFNIELLNMNFHFSFQWLVSFGIICLEFFGEYWVFCGVITNYNNACYAQV